MFGLSQLNPALQTPALYKQVELYISEVVNVTFIQLSNNLSLCYPQLAELFWEDNNTIIVSYKVGKSRPKFCKKT